MNPLPHSDADEQASLWAARLDGSTLSATDRDALDAWLAASPLHRPLLSQYCQFSADLELTLPALVEAGLVAPVTAHGGVAPSPRKTPRLLPVLVATATLAAAAAVALTIWVKRPRTQIEHFATAVAQHQTFTLADGSKVELNARTRLRVAFTRDTRHVELSDGEAFFTVAKDKSRPFIVQTSAGSVRVTGTQFDVRSPGAPEFEVTVAEGTVEVRPGTRADTPVKLVAGEQLSASHDTVNVTALNAAALDRALAWRQGQIVFDHTALRDALTAFARYHEREIVVSAEAAPLTIGGRFSLDDVDGFFSALQEILPVQVTHPATGPIQVTLRKTK